MSRDHGRARWRGRAGGGAFVGPLDAHATDLAIACSVSRRLLSSYAGPLIRLRRSSDNAELDIGYDGAGLLDTAAASAFIGGGTGYAAVLYDQSGLGRHLLQSTTAKQPTYLAGSSAINAVPSFSFGGSQSLQYDAGSGNTFLNGTTAYFVAAMSAPSNGGTGYGRIFSAKASSGNDYDQDASCLLSFDNGGNNILASRNAAAVGVSRPTDTGFVASGRYDSTQVFSGVNGTEGAGGNESGTFAARYFGMGEVGGAGGSFAIMKVAEAVLWNAVPGSSDRTAIIGSRWNFTD